MYALCAVGCSAAGKKLAFTCRGRKWRRE